MTTQPARDEGPEDIANGRTRSGPVPRFAMGEAVPGLLPPGARLVLLASVIAGWLMLIRRFGEGDVYAVIGPYSCVVIAVSASLYSQAVRHWLRPTWRAIWTGLAIGAGMTAATYAIFQLAVQIEPSLDRQVQTLYRGARTTTLAQALAWIVVAAIAEELLFRGAWPATLRNYMPAPVAFGVSLVTYAFAQSGTGSWIVMALALGCGVFWTLQRWYTGSLLSPLISHLIWTPTVILLYPVT